MAGELAELVGVVDDEPPDPVTQRDGNLPRALDRVSVHAAVSRDALRADEPNLAAGRDVETGAEISKLRDHRGERQGLQRVVQFDTRQRALERQVLPTHHLAVDDEERRAVPGDETPYAGGRHGRRWPRGARARAAAHG